MKLLIAYQLCVWGLIFCWHGEVSWPGNSQGTYIALECFWNKLSFDVHKSVKDKTQEICKSLSPHE